MSSFLLEDFAGERGLENAIPIDLEDIEKISWVDGREREDGVVVVGKGVEKRCHACPFKFGEGGLDGKMERSFADAMFDDVLDA